MEKVEIRILRVGKNELELEIKGETYTLLNLLQKTLLEDKYVEIAGGKIQHRLLETASFYLKVKGGKQVFDVLFEALDRIRAETVEFRKAFEKAVEAYEKGKA
ncbi:MAG: DNA-directed RNA polymerase subunit L [Candidatus Hecatellales archaeon]|nr:MAG: DNA-directed RNA polymerase subunit L [Candidatus Hecatellales archaeon]